MNILVTGGAGFIGSHLVDRLLEECHNVICIDDLSLGKKENIRHNLENRNFSFIELSILDLDKLKDAFREKNFDCVFHLAANSDIQKGSTDRTVDLNRTFMTTFNILECMKEFGVKKIIFSSSSAIYGDTGDTAVDEDHGPLTPISFYGASKLASEAFISTYSYHFGIQAWIFRFPNVVGGRATHGVVFDFVNKLRNDPTRLDVLGDGTQIKPYIYVKDLVDAMLFAWKNSNERYNCYNISAPDLSSVREIAEITVEGMDLKDVKINYGTSNIGWKGDVSKYSYDTSKLEKLGFKNKRSSNEAVREAVQMINSTICNS